MNEKLSGAIEALTEQLAEQIQQVAETKKMINALRQRMGQPPMFTDVSVEVVGPVSSRRDLYYGKPMATAAQMYLELRKQACDAQEILTGLEQGGFDFASLGWREKDRLRSFAMSLAKNSRTFHRLPNGTFGLLSWYDERTVRRNPDEKENGREVKKASN